MTPKRYRQINELADAALELEGAQRAAFLDEVCAGDEELRRQIETLVEADAAPEDFLDRPVMEVLAADMVARPSARDLTGRRIEDYEVLSKLGAGGIGEVWLARDLKLDREVALKLLSPKFAGDPKHVRRFQKEARAASTLNHPNIVTVYEIGTTGGVEFIAEERVSGETIRQRLARGPLPIAEALDIGAQAAAALAAAHAAGVVHRDIKPENVIVRPDGLVKVLDFGLARFVERRQNAGATLFDSLSVPGFVLGTVRYMSPEQARGLPVDGRSDVFSLGVMLYEMAAGVPPFSGATPTDTLAAILTGEPAPLSERAPGIPVEFERIVRRCLAKEPAGRYATAEELRQDLKRLAAQPARKERRRPVWAIAAAAATVAAILTLYLVIGRSRMGDGSFDSMRITRLVTRGDPADAAISPDGKLLAYVVNEGAGQSIWVRHPATSDETAAVPAEPGAHSDLVFSPDSQFLYYRRRTPGESGGLYRVPIGRGGGAQRIVGEISGAAAISPDGRRLAFVRLTASSWEAALIVANADGTNESTLAMARRPRFFDQHTVAWSPDGRSIACFAGEATRYERAAFRLMEIRLADRVQRAIGNQGWAWPRSVSWAGSDTLIVNAASRGDDVYQLWTVARGDGHATRLTNDLSNYGRTTTTADGKSLSTLQQDTSAAIWAAPAGDSSRAVRITDDALRSSHIDVAWTPDGKIVYSEPTGDFRNVWTMDADGGSRRQLTSGPENKDQIAISRDNRHIVFKRMGTIWKMDADGGNPAQLTHGALDVHPDLTPDGRTVVYTSFADWSPAIGGEPTLWKVSIEGGRPTQIANHAASFPRVSPDGKRIGCVYFPGKDPRFSANHLAVLGLDGDEGFRIFDASPSDETPVEWSPDGQALDFIVNRGGVGNIWRQPLNGRPPFQVTNFAADEVYRFAWSRDGRLACSRGATTTSVVLIDGVR